MTQTQSQGQGPSTPFAGYACGAFYDEMFEAPGVPRPHYARLMRSLKGMDAADFRDRQALMDRILVNQGITFTVYGDVAGVEKPFPVDLLPRIIPAGEWRHLERGLSQRVRALNLFLQDVYHEGRILDDGVVPRDLVMNAPSYRLEFRGANVPHDLYVHICGTDLIRDDRTGYMVLEDNCRTPSGVSYMLENRELLMRTLPESFRDYRVRPNDGYAAHLLKNLLALAPPSRREPTVVILTPGVYNSAYFEHAYLAEQMGVELVEGRDLFVEDNCVYMKNVRSSQPVDVVYRRVDDDYLDPLVFRKDSSLGVPGLVNAYRAGNVALVNGIGTGVADDKAIYPYVPAMIRYYLDEDPVLAQVPTYLGHRPADLDHILTNMADLVVKSTNESGGYGMLIGPQATAEEIETFRRLVRADPRGYVAQPLVGLSQSPCFLGERIAGRHVDLRPYVLCGVDGVTCVPGGLTRVALREGSYVVNSSQGGGSKDTWVLEDEGC